MNRINLNHLPTELLLEIGDHLSDDVDRACLAFVLCGMSEQAGYTLTIIF